MKCIKPSSIAYKYGQFVFDYRLFVMLASLSTAIILCTGILQAKVEISVEKLFTPTNSSAETENRVQHKIEDDGSKDYFIQIYLTAKTGNILEQNYTDQISNFDNAFRNSSFKHKNHLWTFKELCSLPGTKCPTLQNFAVQLLAEVFRNSSFDNELDITLTYPVSTVWGKRLDLSMAYGVTTEGTEYAQRQLVSATGLSLTYTWQVDNGDIEQNSSSDVIDFRAMAVSWTEAADKFAEKHFRWEGIEVIGIKFFDHDNALTETSQLTLPFSFGSFCLLLSFTSITCTFVSRDWQLKGKFWETVAAVLNPCLAIGASFGLLFYCGIPLPLMAIVTPFLVLSVGIDDGYLLFNAWHRTGSHLHPRERLAQVFKEDFGAVVMTSLTDVLGFGIGVVTNTPAVYYFCIFTSTAILFDFILQMTFFASVLAFGGIRESQGMHAICCGRPAVTEKEPASTAVVVTSKSNQVQPSFLVPKQAFVIPDGVSLSVPVSKQALFVVEMDDSYHQSRNSQLLDAYLNILTKKTTAFFILLICIAQVGISLYGLMRMQVSIDSARMIPDNSDLHKYFNLLKKYKNVDSFPATGYVLKPPDFENLNATGELLKAVEMFENFPPYIKPNSGQLMFWLPEFLNALQDLQVDEDVGFYDQLNNWLEMAENENFRNAIKFKNSSNPSAGIKWFTFQVVCTGAINSRDRAAIINYWRSLYAQVAEWQIYVKSPDNVATDLLTVIPSNLIQAVGIDFLMVGLLAFIFTPNIVAAFFAILSVLVINLGVIGYLSLLGYDIDPITEASVMVSIGYSIGYVEHVVYLFHFESNKSESPVHCNPRAHVTEHICATLRTIVWPVMQGATTSLLGSLLLVFVPAFVPRLFLYTIVLVIGLGVFQSLAVLPCIFLYFNV